MRQYCDDFGRNPVHRDIAILQYCFHEITVADQHLLVVVTRVVQVRVESIQVRCHNVAAFGPTTCLEQ